MDTNEANEDQLTKTAVLKKLVGIKNTFFHEFKVYLMIIVMPLMET